MVTRKEEIRSELELLETNVRASTYAPDILEWTRKIADLEDELKTL